ncbi:MAG: TrkH family potassium uptake protein [Gammaproteobacteria bacterium]|nr:TrkH family potassium uptake protein [Gammaproteobacteria bacterium]
MNYSLISKIIGIMLILFSLMLVIPITVSLLYDDGNVITFIYSFIIILLFGIILYFPNNRSRSDIKTKEGFLIVVAFWLVLSLFGSIPFMFDKQLSFGFADAFFESISGWTTTGATVIENIDILSPSLLIYRQELQWLGGMGIVILALAILPMLGVGGMHLYKAESTGPIKDNKITPRIAETAKSLWAIYLGLTVICAFAYYLAGMTLFDAIAHSFSTIAIGGFSTHNLSIGYFNSSLIELICIFFMLISALNFILHFMAIKTKDIKTYLKDTEFNSYMFIILFVLTTLFFYGVLTDYKELTIRQVLFQSVSFITTSGFTSATYYTWPSFVVSMLIAISFIGACAGSTGGGLKVLRVVLLFKLLKRELLKILHPTAEIPIRINHSPVNDKISSTLYNFFIFYILSYLALSFLLLLSGLDMITSFSAVASCINNLGPALGDAVLNYGTINIFSKYVLSFAMILGRLEIFTLLIVLTPYFWKY